MMGLSFVRLLIALANLDRHKHNRDNGGDQCQSDDQLHLLRR